MAACFVVVLLMVLTIDEEVIVEADLRLAEAWALRDLLLYGKDLGVRCGGGTPNVMRGTSVADEAIK